MGKRMIVTVALLAAIVSVSVFCFVGCSKQPMAIVNGQKITRAEFLDRLESAQGKQVLSDLILRALIEDAFEKSGLTLTDEKVEAKIAEAKSSAPDESAWQQYLESRGMDEAEFREFVTFSLKVQQLATKNVDASEEKLKEFYEQNKEHFARPELVDISEIVVSNKAEADKLVAQLAQNPESFGDLARQHSLSPTRERSGRRGDVPIQQMTPVTVREVVRTLNIGEISKPVEIQENWYILKLEGHKDAHQPSYEEIQEQVKEAYMQQHATSEQELVKEITKTGQVNIVDPKYDELNEFFRPAPSETLPTFGAGDESQTKPAEVKKKPDSEKSEPDDSAGTAPASDSAKPAAAGDSTKEAEKTYKEPAATQD